MKRYLVIGEAPGPRGPRNLSAALAARSIGKSAAAGALAALADPELCAFVHAADHLNLLREFPGGKGSAFPLERARRAARRLCENASVKSYLGVILVGKRVAAAFDSADDAYLEWVPDMLLAPVVVVPHPSGVNRWYNSTANRNRLRRLLRELGARLITDQEWCMAEERKRQRRWQAEREAEIG